MGNPKEELQDSAWSLFEQMSEQISEEDLISTVEEDLQQLKTELLMGTTGEKLKESRSKIIFSASLLLRKLVMLDVGKENLDADIRELRKADEMRKAVKNPPKN